MPVVRLTPALVRQTICPSNLRKVDLFDEGQRGFLLEVRVAGGKTYYQRYTNVRGRTRQFKIGSASALTLDQARKKGREIVAGALLGYDPQSERDRLRTVPTLGQFLVDRYLPFVKVHKRSWRTDETLLRLHIIPRLGQLCMDELSGDSVSSLVTTMRKSRYANGTVNRVLVLLRYAFNLAVRWNVIAEVKNPVTGISAGADELRNRYLTTHEISQLLFSIRSDANVVAANAILLLLLTGARRGEITHAKWDYVDFEKATLLVPLSKSGKPRLITLNSSAIELLKAWGANRDSDFVFPSPVTGRPCASLFFPWDRIRKRAGLADVRLHDLRHTFASLLVNRGVSLYVVQELLGHSNSRTTQRYAHLCRETLDRASEIVIQDIFAQSTGPTSVELDQEFIGVSQNSASSQRIKKIHQLRHERKRLPTREGSISA